MIDILVQCDQYILGVEVKMWNGTAREHEAAVVSLLRRGAEAMRHTGKEWRLLYVIPTSDFRELLTAFQEVSSQYPGHLYLASYNLSGEDPSIAPCNIIESFREKVKHYNCSVRHDAMPAVISSNRKFLPLPDSEHDLLEMLTLNAGEGAFHWIRCPHADGCAGWVYDCGTNSGAKKIKSSITAFLNTIEDKPLSLIIVSHYHKDHISHIKNLSKAKLLAKNIGKMAFWIPEIDSISMSHYLRMLVFSSLFQFRNSEIGDKDLNRLFSKPDHLAQDLAMWFDVPKNLILRAKSGDSEGCPMGGRGITVRALTPPSFGLGSQHPLTEQTSSISYMLSDQEFAIRIKSVIKRVLSVATREGSGLRKHIELYWGPTDHLLLDNLEESVFRALSAGPNTGEDISEESLLSSNACLHMWLAATLFAPIKKAGRLSLSKKKRHVPSPFQAYLRSLPEKIKDATHLFNLIVEFSDGQRSYLLTGDADTRLWPHVFPQCTEKQTAIQAAHHGSEENVFPPAFHEIMTNTYVVSADKFKTWRHPSTRLGVAVSRGTLGAGGSLFCTNVHANCELNSSPGNCRENQQEVRAISVTEGVEWIIDGVRLPAEKCPRI
ncbi:MBL fold metallo-hydrolase [Geomonas anaerohicana]|uniref:Metallo-beta-lactamase domain-containing protein n=1 Tax=Geomonas anaerohicana TaxID=2798583 RepID=A0ABS0YEK5_9BACT|nr:MBL fold metallo-hydrolase [Geomonas anaerohicana]MBJ6750744.1 hypothetical protein [Geomonas anaerohicana]